MTLGQYFQSLIMKRSEITKMNMSQKSTTVLEEMIETC
jgi:hypothetical protein